MQDEDRRVASQISVGLSNTLSASSISVLAILAATYTFLYQGHELGFWFALFFTLSVIAFVCSIIAGGKGVTAVRNSGFDGDWSREAGAFIFNLQALLCAGGIMLYFLAITLIGPNKNSALEGRLLSTAALARAQEQQVITIQRQLGKIAQGKIELEARVAEIAALLKSLDQRLATAESESEIWKRSFDHLKNDIESIIDRKNQSARP